MPNIQSWNVTSGEPVQLHPTKLKLERDLEEWVESKPNMLNPNLVIVGRQLHLGNSGILDLLAIDTSNKTWVVIELKRGHVDWQTIDQASRYVEALQRTKVADLTKKVTNYLSNHGVSKRKFFQQHNLDRSIFNRRNRSFVIYVVGTDCTRELESAVDLHTSSGIEVNIVTFGLLGSEHGEKIVFRKGDGYEVSTIGRSKIISETAAKSNHFTKTSSFPVMNQFEYNPQLKSKHGSAKKDSTKKEQITTPKKLFARAKRDGYGKPYRMLYDAVTKHGIYPRANSHNITYFPHDDGSNWLVRSPANRNLRFEIRVSAFVKHYPISFIRATMILGLGGERILSTENVENFAKDLDRLFDVVERNSQD